MRYYCSLVAPYYRMVNSSNVKLYIKIPKDPMFAGLYQFDVGYHFYIIEIEEVKDIFEDYLVLSVFVPGLYTLSLDFHFLFKPGYVTRIHN